MSRSVTLYHTSGCHLCEKAKTLLWPFLSDQLSLIEMDIAESDSLIDSYGTRIPVLRLLDASELAWPFDEFQLAAFLQKHKN